MQQFFAYVVLNRHYVLFNF